MTTSISDRLRSAWQALNGTLVPEQCSVAGEFVAEVRRADGRVERFVRPNVVTDRGLNRLANRGVTASGTTPFFILGVGTQTAVHTLGSVQAGLGEVSRKTAATIVQSREWLALTMTWAGAADSVTSVALDTAFISDYPSSHASTGIIAMATNGLSVTLGNSDFLNLTYRCRVGSHDVAHST